MATAALISNPDWIETGRYDSNRQTPAKSQGFRSSIVGESTPIRNLFSTLERVAPLTSTVLIQGETGTGKELVARTIHDNSPRAGFPFVAFSAAAIPEGLVEAELFGHVKGSFTGAISDRVGRFELAHHGTLFIDEVSSMPMPLQAKLLRALQEREVERVGASRPIKINTRVIAASNVDLLSLVKQGLFREDLYYRLNVVRLRLPPLRERTSDIPVLIEHFVAQACERNQLPYRGMTDEAMDRFMRYDWPGNIRQLENAVEHAVVMSGRSSEITVNMLPEELAPAPPPPPVAMAMTVPPEGLNFASFITDVERDVILQCLKRTDGNRRQTALLLQLSRTTLIDKLHRLGLSSTPAA